MHLLRLHTKIGNRNIHASVAVEQTDDQLNHKER